MSTLSCRPSDSASSAAADSAPVGCTTSTFLTPTILLSSCSFDTSTGAEPAR